MKQSLDRQRCFAPIRQVVSVRADQGFRGREGELWLVILTLWIQNRSVRIFLFFIQYGFKHLKNLKFFFWHFLAVNGMWSAISPGLDHQGTWDSISQLQYLLNICQTQITLPGQFKNIGTSHCPSDIIFKEFFFASGRVPVIHLCDK